MKTSATVELFYDVVSPYSFLAFEVLLRYQHIWFESESQLVLLGAIMKVRFKPDHPYSLFFLVIFVLQATGNKPPISLPARESFLLKDLVRNSKQFGIELCIPSVFPANTTQAQRILTVLACRRENALLVQASRALFAAYWSNDINISKEQNLRSVLLPILGESLLQDTLAEAGRDHTKNALAQTTQDAIGFGAFGAPTFRITTPGRKPEFFFGSDRFPHITDFLGLEWLGVKPTMISSSL